MIYFWHCEIFNVTLWPSSILSFSIFLFLLFGNVCLPAVWLAVSVTLPHEKVRSAGPAPSSRLVGILCASSLILLLGVLGTMNLWLP